jgi:hypothetical protein
LNWNFFFILLIWLGDLSGTDSYYCDYETAGIMFHCSPLITIEDRIRLLGNDLILIIWVDEGDWDPSKYESQVNRMWFCIYFVILQCRYCK